jgi:hypothetical protein
MLQSHKCLPVSPVITIILCIGTSTSCIPIHLHCILSIICAPVNSHIFSLAAYTFHHIITRFTALYLSLHTITTLQQSSANITHFIIPFTAATCYHITTTFLQSLTIVSPHSSIIAYICISHALIHFMFCTFTIRACSSFTTLQIHFIPNIIIVQSFCNFSIKFLHFHY